MNPVDFKNSEKRTKIASIVCDRLKGNVNDVSYTYTSDEKTNVSFHSTLEYCSSRNSPKTKEQKLNPVAVGSKSGRLVIRLLVTRKMKRTDVKLTTLLSC